MSKATFGVRQPLKSLEFGTLLHNIARKGVYVEPTCSISNDAINVEGGVFILYDTDRDKSYAVRIESVNLTLALASVSAGQWVFMSYTYNASDTAEPVLYGKSSIDSSDIEVRLGRLIQTAGGLELDTSSMEKCIQDEGFMKYFNYNTNETTPQLNIGFNRPVTGSTGAIQITSVDTTSLSGIDKTKAQYLYIDTNGVVKCEDSTVPRFGKLVIAEKAANANFTTVNQFPTRTEINAWDIEFTDHSIWPNTKEGAIYADAGDNTHTHYQNLDELKHIIALSGIIEALVDHVGTLERRADDLNARVTYLEGLVTYFGAQVTIPTAEELTEQSTADKVVIDNVETKSTGEINIKGAVTVDSNTSSFGTADNPIHNLYVTTSLYTDQLFVTE